MLQFKSKLPDLSLLVGRSSSPVMVDSNDNELERPGLFPDGMNYSTFLALYHHSADGHDHRRHGNVTTEALSDNSTKDSPMMAYFPDFCGDW